VKRSNGEKRKATTYFFAVVHKDDHRAFGVTFPDLPGCFSAADRIEDVIPNAAEALDLWFDDRDGVKPSSLDQVREGALAELAGGAFLVAVPRIRNGGSRNA
jgi:Uncharacterized conserved protein